MPSWFVDDSRALTISRQLVRIPTNEEMIQFVNNDEHMLEDWDEVLPIDNGYILGEADLENGILTFCFTGREPYKHAVHTTEFTALWKYNEWDEIWEFEAADDHNGFVSRRMYFELSSDISGHWENGDNADGIGGVKNWTVCLLNVDNETPFSIADITVGGGIFREEGKGVSSYDTTCSIHTMTSAGHEYFDYPQTLLDDVDALRDQYKNDDSVTKVNELIRKNTRPFEKGLLLLYPIADAGELTKRKGSHKTPFGFAAVFPDRQDKGNLQSYRMNDIALEKDNDEFYG